MYSNINLNLLKYFYEVINYKSITKASQKLLISQPAITKAMKELEKELNVVLFERTKTGIMPTTEGEILYNNIKNIFHELSATLNTIETHKNKNQYLYIGSTTTNFLDYIMPCLKQIKIKYPNIHLNIVLEDINVLQDRAKVGKMDIVIKNDYENIENFNNIKNFSITDKFVASEEFYPNLKGRTVSLEELLKNPFVLLSDITHGRRNFDDYLKTKNIILKPAYEFNSYSLCRELIKNGFGIGIGNPIHYQNKPFL